jgi:hypothetical protein
MNLARIGQLLGLAALLAGAAMLMSAGSAFAECSNEQLRVESRSTGLPDCRAYELVTPPAKNGQPPVTDSSSAAASGNAISYLSIGAFGQTGNSSTAAGGEYVATQSSSGWSSTAINPSAQQFQNGSPEVEGASHETLDLSADLTESVFLKPLQGAIPVDSRFYRRNVASGGLSEIGPLLSRETVAAWAPAVAEEQNKPPTVYIGGSRDLSTILFTQAVRSPTGLSWFWPGDTTNLFAGTRSLYEYSPGDSSEPELVGVSNDTTVAAAAAAQHKAHINEAAELIGNCGTEVGGVSVTAGFSIDTYNAISSDAGTVFFTTYPGECETTKIATLYARINREKTVAISEPSTGPTGDCPTCDETEPSSALFQGAAEDGSKVFFLSRQELFEGARGETGINLYEYDFEAPVHEKVSLLGHGLPESEGQMAGVLRVAASGAYVYFVSHDVLATNENAIHAKAEKGEAFNNLYVIDTATKQVTFIAGLSGEDAGNWNGNDVVRHSETTSDGRFLLFPSVADLTADASGPSRQLYRYEAPTPADPAGALARISVGAQGEYECSTTKATAPGFNCDGNAAAPPGSPYSPSYRRNGERGYEIADPVAPTTVAISSDGSKVFFESPTALAPGALNNQCASGGVTSCFQPANNVYEWDDGSVYLISDGTDSNALLGSSSTKLIGANPSGTDVFFVTASPLVKQDTDTQVDIYDAREDGGFPAPASLPQCQGEGCQGQTGVPPVFGVPGTAVFSGSGNLTPPPAAVATPVKKSATQTRAQKLAKALKACGKEPKKKRAKCQKQAKKRYGKAKR